MLPRRSPWIGYVGLSAIAAACASGGSSPTGSGTPGTGGGGTSSSTTGGGGSAGSGGTVLDGGSDAPTDADAGPPAPPLLTLHDSSGWQIYPGGGYRYGPSILMGPGAAVDMWTCSPGESGAWDYIRYRHSDDGGHTWTPDQVVLSPTPGAGDAFSTCDPGAVRVGNYYYIGYTSTQNPNGTSNDLYVARSTSPTGPFQKWSGSGWGDAPAPVVTYTGDPAQYGIGEPSLVLQGGQLFVYYTDDDATGGYTDLAVAADPTADDWPLHLVPHGHVITHTGAQDSIDVKYVDAYQRFLAVSTFDRFGPNATVAAYQSVDGEHFERVPFQGARVQAGAHNMGLSGDPSGHLDVTASNFIAYSYNPAGATWGDWPTFLDPITLSLSPLGTTVGGGVSSIVGGSDWSWSGPKAWDGDDTTVFSSDGHGAVADATEWAYVDLGRSLPIQAVTLVPRAGGYGYPVDFEIQTSDDAATWVGVPGQAMSGHASPGSAPETFPFAASVTARYVRVLATKLGADDNGNHYLQLAEMRVTTSGG